MTQELTPSAQRVQQALRRLGRELQVRELPQSTRTAAEAAQAVGCAVGQIAKSLVFRGQRSGQPILVIASGLNRVDESKVAALIGEAVAKADAEFVRQRTGFAIGGVPPLGHAEPLFTLIDQDLLAFDEIWAAAGTPHAIFPLAPGELPGLTGGRVADVALQPGPAPERGV